MKFANKEECKKFLMEKGMPEDQAISKAEEWEKSEKEKNARSEKLQKSIEDAANAMVAAEDYIEEKRNVNYVNLEKSLKDSMVPDTSTNEVDAIAFLKAIGESAVELRKEINENAIDTGNLLGVNYGLMKSLFENLDSINNRLETLVDLNKSLAEENSSLRSVIDNIDTAVITKGLEKLPIKGQEEPNPGNADKYDSESVFNAFRKSMEEARNTDPTMFDSLNYEKTRYELSGKKYEAINKSVTVVIEKFLK